MRFAYVAYSREGKRTEGHVEAPDRQQAEAAIRERGLYASEVREAGDVSSRSSRSGGHVRAATKQTAPFYRQLSLLLSAGTPIVDALSACERQTGDEGFRSVIAGVGVAVSSGASLGEAMALYPRVFDSVSRSLVQAGESGADLPVMVSQLATIVEKQRHLRSTLVGAMIYPACLLGVCSTVLVVMIAVVLPKFKDLFSNVGAPLPVTTEYLMLVSDWLRANWIATLVGAVALAVVAWFYAKTESGVRAMHMAALRLPVFGRINREFATARVARVLGLLVVNKVPVTDAIAVAARSTANVHFRALVHALGESVERGDGLANGLSGSTLVSESFRELVRTGESSGKLGAVLTIASDSMEAENELAARSMSKLLEPAIMIFMGLLVGAVAVSMFLPLFDLAATTGGGAR